MGCYRLYHTRVHKYVPWPDGRGFKDFVHHRLCAPSLRVANNLWGGSEMVPVLEVHVWDKLAQQVLAVHLLPLYDLERVATNRRRNHKKAAIPRKRPRAITAHFG